MWKRVSFRVYGFREILKWSRSVQNLKSERDLGFGFRLKRIKISHSQLGFKA